MKKKPMKLYCVQAFARSGGRWQAGAPKDCGTEERALAYARALSEDYEGVVAFTVEGHPEFDTWSEPLVLVSYGAVPDLAAA